MIKSTEQKTVNFFKTIEAGDIALFNTFEQAVAVFGYTKAGKTCSCHILCNSIVRAEDKDGELMYVPVNQKYSSAIVGIGNDSQTQIPNIFQTQVKGKNKVATKICVLDQPGYGDSYGFHRIFSNGYFHFRTFSKTPKLKFLLAFKKSDLEGTAVNFKRTIMNFISMFITYKDIKHKILNATAFLVTKAEPRSKLQDLTAVINNLKKLVNDLKQPKLFYYQELIQHMIDRSKIFIIEKPQQIGNQTRDNDMLQRIYDKTQFWVRPTSKNVVDMSDVNFSVANQILKSLGEFQDNELFKEEYAHFMNYMSRRMNEILVEHHYSLKNIIKILKEDAEGHLDQHSFLKAMESFKQHYYDFDQRYTQQRQKLEANLFKSNEDNKNESSPQLTSRLIGRSQKQHEEQERIKEQQRQREKRMVYFLKKFKVLQFIEKQTDFILNREDELVRNIEELEGMSTFFLEMFKKMDILRVQRSDSPKIIYKYSYIIQRLIEQAKIITLILFNKNQTRNHFVQYNFKEQIAFADIFRLLKDKVFTHINNRYSEENSIEKIKINFCKQIDIANFEYVNEQILTFFEQVETIDQTFTKQVIALLIRYAEILNKNKNASPQQKKFLALKLLNYRQKCYKYLNQLNNNKKTLKKDKEEAIEQVFLLSNLLATLLVSFNLTEQARILYKSIANVEMVFKLFQTELKLQQNNPKTYRETLMNYGNYAATVHRKELAMKCYQQAYSKSSLFKEIREAGKAIGDLQKKAEPTEAEDAYLRNFYNENFCSEVDEVTIKKITSFCQK